MKKTFILMVMLGAVIFHVVFVHGQGDQENDENIKNMLPGMKAVPIGSAKLIIPEGAEVRRVTPGLIVPQTAGEYLAEEMPGIMEKIDQKIDQAQQEVTDLTKQISPSSAEGQKGGKDEETDEKEEQQKETTPGILIAG